MNRGLALTRLAGAVLIGAACIPAQAADMRVGYGKAPLITPLYDWSGFYIGGNIGAALSNEHASDVFDTFATRPSGVIGGVQLGYNLLFSSNWLIGLEGEFDWTTAHGVNLSTGGTSLAITSNHNWYDTFDGRLGVIQGPLLYYVKGGAAWMDANYLLSATVSGQTSATWVESTRTGWTIGAGVEYMLIPNWSAKLEYDFLDFGTQNLGAGLPIRGSSVAFNTQVHEIKLGLNYHWLPGTLFGRF